MFHALLLNIAIIAAIIVTILITHNPMVLLALMFLKELPFGLMLADQDEEDEGRPIGFVHPEEK